MRANEFTNTAVTESDHMDAEQVLQYVKKTHGADKFDIEHSITDHPQWELKNIPMSQLRLDPDGEMRDPYNRVNWVDDDTVNDLIPKIKNVLQHTPIVVDSDGWIIDGNHRAMAAAEAGLTAVPALVPAVVKEGVAEGKQPGQPVVDAILKVMPIAQEIWFHGSRATGKHRKNSDTDILVVVPDDLVGDQYLGVVRILQKLSSRFDNYDIQPTHPGYNIHLIAQEEGRLLWSNKQGVAENFADGKNPGRKGLAKRSGVNTKASVSSLRKTAKNSSGEKQRMAHWLANMKAGRAKAKRK
jgi:predicted nucleotidyltransferase